MFIQRYAAIGSRSRGFVATGGTIFDYDGLRVHRFTSSGTFRVLRGSAEIEFHVLGPGTHGRGRELNATWRWASEAGLGGNLVSSTTHISPGNHPVQVGIAGGSFAQTASSFAHIRNVRHAPHHQGSHYEWRGGAGGRYLYGGGGAGIAGNGGDAVAGQQGRAGHGANGISVNWWGQNIIVGAGGGGGVHREGGTGAWGTPGNGGSGGAGGAGGDFGQDGGNAMWWGNGGGGSGGLYPQSGPDQVGRGGAGSNGLVVIRYPLELLEGP